MKLIDKSAVVAEIEARYNECLKRAKIIDAAHWNGKADAYRDMLVVLDTLEVKEVNLDKETTHYLLYEHRSPLNEIMHKADLKSEMQYHKDIENAFKSGFELCLKVQTKNIWHDASEELPVIHRHVLLYTEEGTVTQGMHDGGSWVLDMWVPKFPKILKWCYLSDIIPQLNMITKRYEYWSREGKKWTDWFEWNSDYCPELQLTDRRISSRLKNEYK